MMKRALLLVLAVVGLTGRPAAAQSIPSLPRTTGTTGVNDTALFIVSDSARKTKAITLANLKTAVAGVSFPLLGTNGAANTPTYSWANSTGLGLYRLGPDTLGLSIAGAKALTFSRSPTSTRTKITGPDSGLVILSSNTLRASIFFTQTIAGPNESTTIQIDSARRTRYMVPGTAAVPSIAVGADTANGLYRLGKDTLGFTTFGQRVGAFTTNAGTNATWFGGIGNLTIQAGTGNSRTMTLQATNGSGVAQNNVVLNADGSTTMGALTVSSCTGCGSGGSATVSDTVKLVRFDSVRSVRSRADTVTSRGGASSRLVLQTTTSGSVLTTALRFNELQQGLFADGSATNPSLAFGSDSITGLYRSAANTIGFATNGASSLTLSGGAAATLTGGAGSMILQAGTGASRSLTFRATTTGSVVKDALVLGSDTTVTARGSFRTQNMSNTSPAYGFTLCGSCGMYYNGSTSVVMAYSGSDKMTIGSPGVSVFNGTMRTTDGSATCNSADGPGYTFDNNITIGIGRIAGSASADTLIFCTGAVSSPSLRIAGGTSPVLLGNGSGSMTIQSGTGASRTLTLKTTNSSSAATTFASGSGDTLMLSGHAIAASLTTAAGTPGSICYNTATSEITKNAATSCVVSSRRFKKDITPLPLDWAVSKLMQLQPTSFTYKDGGRTALGIIAENADSVDSRLSFRDAKGQVNSYDQAGVIALLIATAQRQQREIDSLKTEMRRKP